MIDWFYGIPYDTSGIKEDYEDIYTWLVKNIKLQQQAESYGKSCVGKPTDRGPTPINEGLRYNDGKLRMDLIPPEWDKALAEVLTAGADKYAARNWEKGMAWSKVFASLQRHINTWQSGETYDPETGCHHLAMAAWNALALMSYQIRGLGENDQINYNSQAAQKATKRLPSTKKASSSTA